MVQPLPHSPPTPWFCVAQDYQGPVSHKTLPDASRSHRVDALPQSDECGQSKGCTTQEAQIGMGSAASVFMHMWTLMQNIDTLYRSYQMSHGRPVNTGMNLRQEFFMKSHITMQHGYVIYYLAIWKANENLKKE